MCIIVQNKNTDIHAVIKGDNTVCVKKIKHGIFIFCVFFSL